MIDQFKKYQTHNTQTLNKLVKSKNPYHRLLFKFHKFLTRRVTSNFNRIVLKRLALSRTNRPAISTSAICKFMNAKKGIAVIVGTVTDDTRTNSNTFEGLHVCALRFSKTARAKIIESGGHCLSFDQLALVAPTGHNCILLRGRRNAREAVKHFRNYSTTNRSKPRPYVRSFGRKFEKK
jgi:large subunit ribosomal protein L18e